MPNVRFENALKRRPQSVPPVWMMRQAGRYHKHYQKLRSKHSFMELCKRPELAAQVALGPIEDFDFDAAILFSDLLFPLEAMGMGLEYTDHGPALGWRLTPASIGKLETDSAIDKLHFQKEAMRLTRQALAPSKSLIGFVGGPWTLFSYAVQGKHEGGLKETIDLAPDLFAKFCEIIVPLLIENIRLQFDGGADVVMIFDTAAGELDPQSFQTWNALALARMADAHPGRLGYYSRGTVQDHLKEIKNLPWTGMGVDSRWNLPRSFSFFEKGFVQGNFNQLLLKETLPREFRSVLAQYLKPFLDMPPTERAGWICGLGHGVLPQTPEDNVRAFVDVVRELFSKEAAL